jgi:flagellar hook-associated protein 1 FlgK
VSNLFGSLSTAARSLDAQQFGLDVTGKNIANVNTDGYSRRKVSLTEMTSPNAGTDGGVTISGAPAQRDAFLEARLRTEEPGVALGGTIANALGVVQTSLGETGKSLDGDLSAFFDAFRVLTQDPTSSVSRDTVISQAVRLAKSFNDMTTRLDASETAADTQIKGSITQINALTTQIASLNAAIGGASGTSAESLKDQQAIAIRSLSKLAQVDVMQRSDGGLDVTIGDGRALVVGGTSYQLGAAATPPAGMTAVVLNGTDITGEIQGGQMGGALQVRDTYVPQYQAQLDTLANALVTQVNAVHSAGYALDGVTTGTNFFTPLGAVPGSAKNIAVNPALTANSGLLAASQSGAAGDNQTAKAIAALADAPTVGAGGATFMQAWSQIVFQVGSDTQNALAAQQSHQDVLSAVQQLRDSVSGVSLDDEATAMLTFQRGYQANAKFFSTVNDVIDLLMNMVKG